jgi:hypothetical protein
VNDDPELSPALGRFAALKNLYSKNSSGGYISKTRKKKCINYCDIATGVCAVAGAALYGASLPQVAAITVAGAGAMQAVKGAVGVLAASGGETSAHGQAGSDHRSSKAKTEGEAPFEQMEKGLKQQRSIDSESPKVSTKHNLPARFQNIQDQTEAHLQMEVSD